MPDQNYLPEDRRKDAVEFADSRFGKHYLSRLKAAKKRALEDSMNKEFTRDFRITRSDHAAQIDKELDYFRLATMRVKQPDLFDKLMHRKPKQKEEPDINV